MPQTIEQPPISDLTKALFGEAGTGLATPVKTPQTRRTWMYVAGFIVLLAIVAAVLLLRKAPAPAYGTTQVKRTTLAKTISATGRLQALTTVQVGTQASGTISEIYADFNSEVKKGQVIAKLDPAQMQAQLTQSTANLTAVQASVQTAQSGVVNAQAAVESAVANVARLQSVVDDAKLNVTQTQGLVDAGVAARRTLETAQAAVAQAMAQLQQGVAQVNQAKSQVQSANSQLLQARAQVTQAQAAVDVASVNLQHTIITAPIDGTVVARSVDVGQTVASSLQAPTLFMIANDLTRMQVLADIDEADVGQLKPQSHVSFTVDAYPTETFTGSVSQIRLSPQTVQNVVTYTAVIDVANAELKLKPGMTASVTATVAEQKDVLAVPNTALRFRPEGVTATPSRGGSGTVYRVNGETLEPVKIRLGLTDGMSTQIVSGGLKEGDRIAIPALTANKAGAPAAAAKSPFGGNAGRPQGGRIR
ncbi:MAG: efflux RND transporter periplasmic adaptor subunit [Bryobacteraceae bacterium]